MKFRILSDLHLAAVQNTYFNGLNFLKRYRGKRPNILDTSNDESENIYTLIAGDIAADMRIRKRFFEMYPELKGCWVEGNHIFYTNEQQLTLKQHLDACRESFKDSPMKFLENDVYEIPNTDIVVIGATMWTDFKLFINNQMSDTDKQFEFESAKDVARRQMNDYRWGIWSFENTPEDKPIYYPKQIPIHLRPEHTIELFNESLEYFEKMLKKYSNKRVIMLTHHCPSFKCCPKKPYDAAFTKLSVAYASNLDSFIMEHPNIVLWVCGHCHERRDFYIGDTRIVMNPIGYTTETRIKEWNTFVEL